MATDPKDKRDDDMLMRTLRAPDDVDRGQVPPNLGQYVPLGMGNTITQAPFVGSSPSSPLVPQITGGQVIGAPRNGIQPSPGTINGPSRFDKGLRIVGDIGRGIGSAVGQIAAPWAVPFIPGTIQHQWMQQGQERQNERFTDEEAIRKAQAEHEQAETGAIPARVAQEGALTEEEKASTAQKQEELRKSKLPQTGTLETSTGQELVTTKDPETGKVTASPMMTDPQMMPAIGRKGDPGYVPPSGMASQPVTGQVKNREDQPLGSDRVSQFNKALGDRWKASNPTGQIPTEFQLPPNATQADLANLDRIMQQSENARSTDEQRKSNESFRQQAQQLAQENFQERRASREAAEGNKDTARADRSYQYNSGVLDKVQLPIDQIGARFGRLEDTLAQKSPQADALVAPELLTIMAGGQGSGIRMNEAEISRVVGGRSHWQDLKASIQKWNTDPQEARSITPEQDSQIRALISTVGQKLSAKRQALDDARDALINSDDPKEHRQIVVDARKRLDAIDGAGEQKDPTPDGMVGVQIPGHSKGYIPKDRLDDFKKAHPGAKVNQ